MPVKNYDSIIAILRNQLLANTELVSFIGQWSNNGYSGTAIYPTYIDAVQNPVYPALTICMDETRTLKNHTGYCQYYYYIHGWIKPNDSTYEGAPDDAAYLYNLVVQTLDLQPIPGLALCRKLNGKCPLYERATRTVYFMTEWLIYASNTLLNA